MVQKKKEELKEEVKSLTDERTGYELEYEEKRKQIEKTTGNSSLGKTDFVKFQENINQKLVSQRKK